MAAPIRFNHMCDRAVMGTRLIGENLRAIKASQGMPFNRLSGLVTQIRQSRDLDISPLVDAGTQTAVNTVVARFIGGWATPHQSLSALRTEIASFLGACRNLLASIGDPVSFSPSTGEEVWVDVTASQLRTLDTSIDAVLAALAPLE